MKDLRIDECLIIRYDDDKDLFNKLLYIFGYTKSKFAGMFDITEDAVSNWTRDSRDVPKWAMRYLIDKLELELRLMGYIMKHKKMTTLTNEIRELQEDIVDLRLEVEIPQSPLDFEIGNLVTDDKPLNMDILVNGRNMIEGFYDEYKKV